MNVTEPIRIDGSAFIGWNYLPADARERITRALSPLAGIPSQQWRDEAIEPWRPAEQIYALHTMVGPDHLVVLFQPDGDGIRVLHLVLKETIDRYFTPKNGA